MAIDLSKLEPEAAKSAANGEALALFSIAISLKRLADAWGKSRQPPAEISGTAVSLCHKLSKQ